MPVFVGTPHQYRLRGGHAFLVATWATAGCSFDRGLLPIDGGADAPKPPNDTTVTQDSSAAPDAAPDAFVGVSVHVNIEGAAYSGIDYPGSWSNDLGVCPNATRLAVSAGINQTADDVLFQTAAVRDPLDCTIGGLPSGMYDVTLLFAEIACAKPASRTFSVALESAVMTGAFDLIAAGNGCALAGSAGQPVAIVFTVPVTDGTLNVRLASVTGSSPLLSALAAVQTSAL